MICIAEAHSVSAEAQSKVGFQIAKLRFDTGLLVKVQAKEADSIDCM